MLWDQYDRYSYLLEEEAEVQKNEVICLRSHSKCWARVQAALTAGSVCLTPLHSTRASSGPTAGWLVVRELGSICHSKHFNC